MVTREEAAHALVGQPFAFEVRGGLLTVHTSASVKGEQWKQRWQQCMRDVQRGDAVCVEASALVAHDGINGGEVPSLRRDVGVGRWHRHDWVHGS